MTSLTVVQIFQNVSQRVATVAFTLIVTLLNIEVTICLVRFCSKMCHQSVSKVDQSGHTAYNFVKFSFKNKDKKIGTLFKPAG